MVKSVAVAFALITFSEPSTMEMNTFFIISFRRENTTGKKTNENDATSGNKPY